MESTTAKGAVLLVAFLVFLIGRAVIRLMGRRADRARGVVHERVERFLED
jgi:hypothetical protein